MCIRDSYDVECNANVLFDEEHCGSAVRREAQRAEQSLHHDGGEPEGQLIGEHDLRVLSLIHI